jgi:hypothetical protein
MAVLRHIEQGEERLPDGVDGVRQVAATAVEAAALRDDREQVGRSRQQRTKSVSRCQPRHSPTSPIAINALSLHPGSGPRPSS